MIDFSQNYNSHNTLTILPLETQKESRVPKIKFGRNKNPLKSKTIGKTSRKVNDYRNTTSKICSTAKRKDKSVYVICDCCIFEMQFPG